jgi:DNA polymerase
MTEQSRMTLQEAWQQFVDGCQSCQRCPLSKSRQHVVISRGAVPAPLMFIGEGPGADEDAQGVPFVGAAGRLLDLLLVAYDLKPDIYHIANIVKVPYASKRVRPRNRQRLVGRGWPPVPGRVAK